MASPVLPSARPGSRQSSCTAMSPSWLPARERAAQRLRRWPRSPRRTRNTGSSSRAKSPPWQSSSAATKHAASPWRTSRLPEVRYGSATRKVRFGGRRPAAQQGLARGPLLRCIEILQEACLARCKDRHRHAIAIEQTVAGQGRKPRPWCQHADEVERIGGGNRDILSRSRLAAQLAQQADGLWQGELLTGETGNKAPAAYFAVALRPPIDAQELAPWRQPCCLPFNQPPEHHPVARQERSGHMLDRLDRGLGAALDGAAASQCPATGLRHAGSRP